MNFKKTYLGGRNEVFVFGTVQNTQTEIIKYLDFESQYPSASRLTQAELQLKLAANGTLHEYLCYDTDSAIKDFWKTAELVINCMKNQIPLPDSFTEKILGNVTFNYSKIKKLIIRTRLNKKLRDIYINSGKKGKPKKHTITISMLDLLSTVSYSHLVNKISLDYLKKNIKIIASERLLLNTIKPHGKELFTKLVNHRRTIKEKLKNPDNTQYQINQLNATQENIKYVMNSGYGLTTEGISKDYIGKFQVLSVGCLIIACARFLNYSAEILYRMNNATPIYSDTDSIIALAIAKIHKQVLNFFKKTIKLKEETEYGIIVKIHILGKKKYGIIRY